MRLRAWGLDRALSGDVITEQNIHALDVASWFVDRQPLAASGTCGKKGRQDPGTCNDHFAVIFTYPTVPRFHPDEAPLDCLAEILGSGRSSYLYKSFV